MARPEGLKSEARRAERVEFLGEGIFPSPPAIGGLGALQLATPERSPGDQPIKNILINFIHHKW